jgi:hypothetical protein
MPCDRRVGRLAPLVAAFTMLGGLAVVGLGGAVPAAAATPAFVQQVSTHALNKASDGGLSPTAAAPAAEPGAAARSLFWRL